MGYDFTGGRIFDFCIDFSMGLTTVQRYCAACDHAIIRFETSSTASPEKELGLYVTFWSDKNHS